MLAASQDSQHGGRSGTQAAQHVLVRHAPLERAPFYAVSMRQWDWGARASCYSWIASGFKQP